MYLQLYGMSNTMIETYDSIPAEYVTVIIGNLSLGLYDTNVNQVSSFYNAIDASNYKVILVFLGANSPQTTEFTQKNIQAVIDQINSKNSLQTTTTLLQTNISNNTTTFSLSETQNITA